MTPVLQVRDITKRFPGVLANDRVSFTLEKGEIHAFLGENGAGKSTLMNVLYGLYSQDEGEIFINGQQVEISEPNDAIAQGIGMVHQHFQLVSTLTVTENMILGAEVTRGAFLDRRKAAGQIRALSEQYGLQVDPDALVGTLPVGVQQRVEILKMLYRQADILILDEPTAVLTPQEADELFVVMKSLVASGKSIIFITHKLKEVLAVADRISVLRAGRVAGTTTPSESDERQLAAMMVGREVVLTVEKESAQPGETVLQVQDLCALDNRFQEAMRGVSLDVRAGEILGVAGVQGNGQTELVEVITGLRQATSGRVALLGEAVTKKLERHFSVLAALHIGFGAVGIAISVFLVVFGLGSFSGDEKLIVSIFTGLVPISVLRTIVGIGLRKRKSWASDLVLVGAIIDLLIVPLGTIYGIYAIWVLMQDKVQRSPRDVTEAGTAHIPENRQKDGLVLSYPILDNLVLNTYYRPPFAKRMLVNEPAIIANATKLVETFDVRTPSIYLPASNLSGGNQQKVIVARELSRPVKLLIAAQPTRGLDVGSIEFIHGEIIKMRDQGAAVLLVSAELDEIMALSDRIAVMFEGRVVAVVDRERATREELGLLMAGSQVEERVA